MAMTPSNKTNSLETTTPPLSFTANTTFEDYTSKTAPTATTGVPYSNPPPVYLVSPPPRPLCMVCFLKLPEKNPPPFFPGPPPSRPACTDSLRSASWKNPPPLFPGPPPSRPPCTDCLRPASWINHDWL